MLREVLQAVASAKGPLNVGQLSRQLGVAPSALQGMILYWVGKGRIRIEGDRSQTAASCDGGHCGFSCPGPAHCPFIVQLPQMISLSVVDENNDATDPSTAKPGHARRA